MDPPVSLPIAMGTIPAATALPDPPLEPPGDAVQVPGVSNGSEMRIGGSHTVGKLMHVRFAHDDSASGSQALDYCCIVFRNVVCEEFRSARGTNALCAENILNCDWDTVQRPAILSVRQILVGLPGLAFRHFGRDCNEGFQFGIERRDAAQGICYQFQSRYTSFSKSLSAFLKIHAGSSGVWKDGKIRAGSVSCGRFLRSGANCDSKACKTPTTFSNSG